MKDVNNAKQQGLVFGDLESYNKANGAQKSGGERIIAN